MLIGLHWPSTLLWIILSGVIGAWYVRQQGAYVMNQLRRTLAENQLPTNVIVEGVLVLFAGALLITPGILTDLLGFSILTPFCRRWYRKQVIEWFKARLQVRTFGFGPQAPDHDPNSIDAEVVGRKTGPVESFEEDTMVNEPRGNA